MIAFCAPALAYDGREVAEAAGCALCHTTPGIATPPRTASCTECHAWIHQVAANPAARAKAMAVFPKWERYERSVQTYAAVPDLGAAFARLDPAWLRSYLADPHDLRPAMPETMVRLGLDGGALDAIVTWAGSYAAVSPATPAPDPKNLEAGKLLYQTRGCPACHAFGATAASPGTAGAPDLRHARDRMGDDAIVAWIVDPQAVSATASMPAMGLTVAEATAVRDWLVLADPGGKAPSTPSAAPTPKPGATWEVLEERVFGRICAHCHMDPAQNDGRAGPGNAGGFGWPATGLELQTCASVRDHREAIVVSMLRRRQEAARDVVGPGEVPGRIARPALPGMPLGLPPIADEDIALTMGWDAADCPP